MNKWANMVCAVLATIFVVTTFTEVRTYDTANEFWDKVIVTLLWFGVCVDHATYFLKKHKEG